MIIEWILFILTFLIGYYLGGKGKDITQELQQRISDSIKDKPTPGVVRQLTEEEVAEKHDPKKKGNLEAFNRLFADLGIKKPRK